MPFPGISSKSQWVLIVCSKAFLVNGHPLGPCEHRKVLLNTVMLDIEIKLPVLQWPCIQFRRRESIIFELHVQCCMLLHSKRIRGKMYTSLRKRISYVYFILICQL